jgi:hypothetical protein
MQNAMSMASVNAMGIASVFGPFLLIMGLWMVFYHENMMKVISSIKNTPGVMYVMGIINLLIGLSVLSSFNMWMWGPTLLVTLFGWVVLIRGLLAFFMPQFLVTKPLTDHNYLRVKGIVVLVWGFCMCWFAFWMV